MLVRRLMTRHSKVTPNIIVPITKKSRVIQAINATDELDVSAETFITVIHEAIVSYFIHAINLTVIIIALMNCVHEHDQNNNIIAIM